MKQIFNPLLLFALISITEVMAQSNSYPWNLYPIETRAYPFASAVRVGTCSGALVGKRLVLTAYHCVPNGGRGRTIQAGVLFGEAEAEARVVDYWLSKTDGLGKNPRVHRDNVDDWAVLVIDKDLGSDLGYFSFSGVRNNLLSIGFPSITFYSKARKARYWAPDSGMVETGCGYTFFATGNRDVPGLHKTSCAVAGGSSGGPLMHCSKDLKEGIDQGYSNCKISAMTVWSIQKEGKERENFVLPIPSEAKRAIKTLQQMGY